MSLGKFRIWMGNGFWPTPNSPKTFEASVNCDGKVRIHGLKADEFKPMFCMGRQDKNGKDIYEGDIVSVMDDNNVFVVKFGLINRNVVSHGGKIVYPVEIMGFYFEALDDKKAYYSITKNSRDEHDLQQTEIIGNIYENPELL